MDKVKAVVAAEATVTLITNLQVNDKFLFLDIELKKK